MIINYNGKHGLTFAKIDSGIENMFARDSWLDFHLVPTVRPYIALPEIEPKIISIPGTNKRYDVTRFLPGGMQKGIRKGTWSFIIDHNQWPNWAECQNELIEYFHGHLFYVTLNDEADAVEEERREGPPKHYAGRLTIDGFDTGENYTTVTIGYSLSDKLANIPSANIYYSITFLGPNGETLQSGYVQEGELPEFTGTLPEIEDWMFTHWEPELKPAYRNETYQAVYEYARKSALIERTITAFNDPNSLVSSIGQYAFAGCTLLSEVTLGANSIVSLVNSSAFYSTKVAVNGSFYVPESLVSEYKTTTNWSMYSTKIYGIENLNDAENITESEAAIVNRTIETAFGPESIIGSYAFAFCSNLQIVIFPVCSRISYRAFWSCSSLQSVSFPVCNYIDNNAFMSCSSLQSVSFPVCSYIGSSAFMYCSSLQSVSFPVCSYIGGSAFMYCSSLQSVSFPVCSYIGSYAFALCSSLQSVSFPVCSYIGRYAFATCSSLQSVSFPVCSYIGEWAFTHCSSLQSVSFPVCSYIGSSAFISCSNLQSISFPVCSRIDRFAFAFCSNLQSVSFPVCSYIGTAAFASCSSLQSISFPVCSIIDDHAFQTCSNLQSISFPVCSRIGDGAFMGCSSLQSVSFPVCSIIGPYAFINCSTLQSVSFPVCSRIGCSAFMRCSNLQSVSFPVCNFIDEEAFRGCSNLQKLYLLSTSICSITSRFTDLIFNSTPIVNSQYLGYFGSVYVPASLVDAYRADSNWSGYADRITAYLGN